MPVSFDQVLELVSRLELTKKQRNQLVEVIQEKEKPKAKILTTRQVAFRKEFVDDMKQALHEVELHQQGKIKLKTLDELLEEIKQEEK